MSRAPRETIRTPEGPRPARSPPRSSGQPSDTCQDGHPSERRPYQQGECIWHPPAGQPNVPGMAVVIAFWCVALWYALACVNKVWTVIEDSRARKQVSAKRIQQEAATPQTDRRSVLVDGTDVPSLPLPPSDSQTGTLTRPNNQPAWLVSHDEAITLLSPNLRAEFTEQKKGTPSSVPNTLVTERSEVTSRRKPSRLPTTK